MRLRLILVIALAAMIAESSLAASPFEAAPPSPEITTPDASIQNPIENSPSTIESTTADLIQGAKPFSLSQLPDDIVQSLRDTLGTTESPGRKALRNKLDGLHGEMDAGMPAQRAASHRAEIQQLRNQLQRELSDLQAQISSVAGEKHAAEAGLLAGRIGSRFQRIDAALERLEKSRDEGEARGARAAMASLLDGLRAPAEAIPQAPVPTLTPMRPLSRQPGQGEPSRNLPRYALDATRELRRANSPGNAVPHAYGANGFGFFRVAATLPNVAPETTTDCNAGPSDLNADGAEVQITPEIQALAQALQYSPARILSWMLKEVRFEPYWGSLKGSIGVLQTRAGNATDQSSLLIALLRASNIPARYVRGTVALYDMQPRDNPTGRAQRWLGTKNYSGSAAYMNYGVPGWSYSIDGTVQGIAFDHVWVQACVPFAAYRGNLADAGGYRWLPLDPSVKDHDYQAGITVNLPLDVSFYTPYMASRTDKLPPDYLADKVETAARFAKSDASVEDVPYRGTPRTLRMDVLPSATPYEVTQFTNWPGSNSPETAAVPDAHRHKFAVTVKNGTNGSGATLATTVITFPQSVMKRVTVSYAPVAASQSLWNSWGGSLASLPTESVNVYPQIKLDGTVLASGSAAPTMTLGSVHTIVMKVTQGEEADGRCIADSGVSSDPLDADVSCLNKTVYTNVKAGAYYALGVNAKQTSDALLAQRAALLAAGVRNNPSAPTPASGAAYEATVGELLHLVLQSYIHATDLANKRIAELRGFRSAGNYDIGLTGSDLKTDYVFDLPLTVKPAGVYVDFKGLKYAFAKIDSAAPTQANPGESFANFLIRRDGVLRAEQAELAKFSIYAGSALEHRVWQEALRTDAVSTVRGLQFAAESSIPVVTFTSANIGQYATLMQMSGATSMAAYQTAIAAEVAAGATVKVPRAKIEYTDPVNPTKAWRGAVYMTENAITGAYGALIDGSLSGGFPLINSTPLTVEFSSNTNATSFQSQADGGIGLLFTLTPGQEGSNLLANMFADPVNMLTGNFTHQERDFNIKGRGGLPIVLDRWYNSGAPKDGPLGFGWTHSFNHVVKLYGVENGVAKVGWVNGSGGESFFSTASHTVGDITRGATLTNSAGVEVQFTRVSGGANDGKYRIRERNGLVYLFASATGPSGTPTPTSAVFARLESITDRNGNALTLNYSGTQLTTVTDSLNRTVLTFTWTGSHVTRITDFSERQVNYAYTDGNNNLTQVTDALGQVRGYSYYTAADGAKLNHHLKRYTLPRGNGMEFEYYSGGQVFRHTPFGTTGGLIASGATTFHYNLFIRESWSVNERGFEHRFTFDSFGNAVRIVEENGAVHTYTYDPARPYNRLSETDSIGRTTAYTYNAQNLLETKTLPSGAVIEYRDYTNFAQPQRIRDARGNWSWLRYDAAGAGNLTDTIRVKSGVVPVAGTQPGAGNIVAWTRIAYDNVGNPTTVTRVKDFVAGTGPAITRNWDATRLNVASLNRAGNRNGATVTETTPTFTYDSLGRLKTGVDSRWYAMALDYDALDRVISATDGLGKPRAAKFDGNGNAIASELIDGGARIDSAAMSYDERDRLIRVLDHAGNLSAFAYDEAGNRVRQTSPDNFTIGFDYDPNNRPTAAFDAEGNRVHTQLDTQGRVLSATDSNGNTVSYQYWDRSSDGRLRRVTQPGIPGQSAGRSVEYDYDGAGNVIRSRVLAGDGSGASRQSYSFLDELGRTVRSVGAPDDSGNRLQVCSKYDNLSNPTEVWAGPSNDTTSTSCNFADANLKRQASFTWDDFGQQLSRTDALNRIWITRYDYYGNLQTSQSPEQAKLGTNTSYTPDPGLNGVLKVRSVPATGGAAGQSVSYTRNALGQVTRAETRDGANNLIVAYTYGYDAAHRLASIADSRGNKTLGYAWTPGGRLSRLTLSDNGSITHRWDYKYDAVGQLSAIVAPNGQSVVFAIDAAGRLRERGLGNGLSSKYGWNADGSLSAVEHLAGSTQLAKHAYTYDAWGNRNTGADTLGGMSYNKTYGYDALDRLKSVSTGNSAEQEGYSYDLYGNRTGKTLGNPVTQSWTYLHDGAQQLNQIQRTVGATTTDVAFARYDDNGNMKKLCEAGGGSVSATATDCSGSITTSLAWDGLEQLATLSRAGAAALNEAYTYDDTGRRLKKSSGATTTHYLYDGANIVGEWNGSALSGAPGAVYAHGSGSDEPLMRLSGNSGGTDADARYYAQDGIGSVVALATAGTALNLARQAGNTLSTSGDYYGLYYPGSQLNDGVTTPANFGWVGYIPYLPAVSVTFASATAVDRVDLMGWYSYYLPSAYVVETQNSNGSWTQVASGGSADFILSADGSYRAVKSFSAVITTALRIRFTAAMYGYVSLIELQVWSAAATAITQRFDAWGNLVQATGSIPTYGYTGREPDQSGLTYYRARYYHPGLGRFVSRDPLGLAAGINPYTYVNNNPINFNDPTGLLAATPNAIQVAQNTQQYFGATMTDAPEWGRYAPPAVDMLSQLQGNYLFSPGARDDGASAGPSAANRRSGTWDPVTDRRISQLDPRFQPIATDFINTVESELSIQLRVTDGYRSIAEQDALYKLGRSEPGKIVTWARGGESQHNYGLAIDVVQMQNGRPNYGMSASNWGAVGRIGEGLGMQWGGRWAAPKTDRPHFEWSP